MKTTRRELIALAGVSMGTALSAPRIARATTAALSPPARATIQASSNSSVASLQTYLQTHASSTFSLPPPVASPPQISWAGPMSMWPAASSLPNGTIYSFANSAFGGPIRSRFTASLIGRPATGSYPALAVNRPYTCKGVAKTVGSASVFRLSTDAPVIELAGVVLAGAPTSQTLIVNGQLCPPKAVSVSNGAGGGYNSVGLKINFGSRATRDIWIETGIYPSYVKLGQGDSLNPISDSAEPQMTVVGDSFLTYSSNAFGNGAALALEIGARLGIRKIATDTVTGSGYWNSGYDTGNLLDRVAAHAADNSNLYLVMAGLNDYTDYVNPPHNVYPTRAQYEAAVASYFQSLRAAQPNAVIAVTAPFSPNPTLSDASYVLNPATNTSGLGDFAYKSQVQRSALAQIAGPWVWIDVLMGGGWINSSGASGGATGLQWLTGGIPATGTSATYKPGNPTGGAGGGFGGIASVPVLNGGSYSQAPDILASGGSGRGLLLTTTISSNGAITAVRVLQPGSDYTAGAGLPILSIDPTFQLQPGTLGTPVLMGAINGSGSYPLPAFAPAGVTTGLSNAVVMLMPDQNHPSPVGVDYLANRLSQSLYEAVLAL